MNTEVILWIFGAILTAVSMALGWLASRQNDQGKDIANLRQHMAENYVRGPEIAEVKQAVNELRKELTNKVDELLKAVNQLVGKHGA